MALGYAIDLAIDECIEKGVLADFLTRRRSEVKNSILTEYNEEFVMAELSRESYEDGVKAGEKVGIKAGENRFAKLTQLLLKDNKTEKLSRAAADEKYRIQLYEEYNL